MKHAILALATVLGLGSGSLTSEAQDFNDRGPLPTREVRRFGKVHGAVYWFGVPRPGARIFLHGAKMEKSFVTLANGHYEFKVPAGTYYITAPGPWASEAFRTEIVIVEKGEVDVVDFWFW